MLIGFIVPDHNDGYPMVGAEPKNPPGIHDLRDWGVGVWFVIPIISDKEELEQGRRNGSAGNEF